MNERSKEDCAALHCALKKMEVENCFECQRVTYCEKRQRSIDECLVFRPKREFEQSKTYALSDQWKKVMITFAKHVFNGKNGLAFTHRDPLVLGREFVLEDVEFYWFVPENFDDLEGIREVFTNKIKEKDIVLFDGVDVLIRENNLKKILSLIGWMSKKALSHQAALLILTEDLEQRQKEVVNEVIADSRVKEVLKSVSNPKRIEILAYLMRRGKSVFTEIYKELGYSVPPKLSFHLKILKGSGIIEQDDKGVYYISDLGRAVGDSIDKIEEVIMGEKIPEEKKVRIAHSEEWDRKYTWYIRRMRRIDPTIADILSDIENSSQLIFGKRKTQEIFQTVLTDYVETEKRMSLGEVRRIISEIAFVFLVDSIPLVEAIEWADELFKRHDLRRKR